MGHARPFAFETTYEPDDGMGKFQAGTTPMISLVALEAAVDLWLEVDLESAWRKSRALSELMIELIDARCAEVGVTVVSPRDPALRGSHVALRHPKAYGVARAMIDRGVIGDFRPPDVMRFSITPLYLRYVDIWDAVDCMVDVLRGRHHEAKKYSVRQRVT
jgi:kynureninase